MSQISGSGGGKSGGGGGGISQDPDTLSSVTFARIIDLIGEGEIYGLVNGDSSVYLDGVPFRSPSGTQNFQNFRYRALNGAQSQETLDTFGGSRSEISVGLKVIKTLNIVTRSVPDPGADAARITLAVQGLSETTEQGKVQGTFVDFILWKRRVGQAWTKVREDKIDGKTTSRYSRSYEFDLADLGPGPYEIGVQRIKDDSTSALLVDDLYWDSYTVINTEKFVFPNSALVGLEVDARGFSSIPSRSYHVRGLLIRVPKNYDPDTRTYATSGAGTTNGTWDGTFKVAYSNNPAWCYYDLVTNPRYGCGDYISESQVDKWALYEIGKYCDEIVPTGLSGNVIRRGEGTANADGSVNANVPGVIRKGEPRFTLNCVINTVGQANKIVNMLASCFRAMTYWSSNALTLTQDRPGEPEMLYTNANVLGGSFVYEGSSREDRHSVAMISWNDPEDDFRPKVEYVEDREAIERYGLRPLEALAFGCTSKSQARRLGLFMLYTEKLETEAVKFTVGRDSAFVRPGSIVKVQDNNVAGVRWGGRLLSATAQALTLDAPLVITLAGNHKVSTLRPNGSVVTNTVNLSVGSHTVINLPAPLPEAPLPGSLWVVESATQVTRLCRVVSTMLREDGFEIVALEHNPSKFNAIDLGAGYEEYNYSSISYSSVPDVTGLNVVENIYRPAKGTEPISVLEISWDKSTNQTVTAYEMKYTAPDGSFVTFPPSSSLTAFINNVQFGDYTISVRARNPFGMVGRWTTLVYAALGSDIPQIENVQNLAFEYTSAGVRITWDRPIDNPWYDMTQLQQANDWVDGGPSVFSGQTTWYIAPWTLANGTYKVLAKHRDRAGDWSVTASFVIFDITDELRNQWTGGVSSNGLPDVILTPGSVNLPSDDSGKVTDLSQAVTTATVLLDDGTDITADGWTFTGIGNGVTFSQSGTLNNVFTVTSYTSSAKNLYNNTIVQIHGEKQDTGRYRHAFLATPSITVGPSAGSINNTVLKFRLSSGAPSYEPIRADILFSNPVFKVPRIAYPYPDTVGKSAGEWTLRGRFKLSAENWPLGNDGSFSIGTGSRSITLYTSGSVLRVLARWDGENPSGVGIAGQVVDALIGSIQGLESTGRWIDINLSRVDVGFDTLNNSRTYIWFLFVDGIIQNPTFGRANPWNDVLQVNQSDVYKPTNFEYWTSGNIQVHAEEIQLIHGAHAAVSFPTLLDNVGTWTWSNQPYFAPPTTPAPDGSALSTAYIDVFADNGSLIRKARFFLSAIPAQKKVVVASFLPGTVTLQADESGKVITYSGASSSASVFVDGVNSVGGWTVTRESQIAGASVSVSGSTVSITSWPDNLDSGTFTFAFSREGFDRVTANLIVNKNKGGAAVAMSVSRPSLTLRADESGVVSSYVDATSQVSIRVGVTETVTSWTMSIPATSAAGMTATVSSSGLVTITNMAANLTNGWVRVRAVRSGYTTREIDIPVAKVFDSQLDVTLSPPQVTVDAVQTTGEVPASSLVGKTVTAVVKRGATDETASWTIAASAPGGASTWTQSAAISTLTAVTAASTDHDVTLTFSRTGYRSFTRTVRLIKNRVLTPGGLQNKNAAGVTEPWAPVTLRSGWSSYAIGNATISVRVTTNGRVEWRKKSTDPWQLIKLWYSPETANIGTTGNYQVRFVISGMNWAGAINSSTTSPLTSDVVFDYVGVAGSGSSSTDTRSATLFMDIGTAAQPEQLEATFNLSTYTY